MSTMPLLSALLATSFLSKMNSFNPLRYDGASLCVLVFSSKMNFWPSSFLKISRKIYVSMSSFSCRRLFRRTKGTRVLPVW